MADFSWLQINKKRSHNLPPSVLKFHRQILYIIVLCSKCYKYNFEPCVVFLSRLFKWIYSVTFPFGKREFVIYCKEQDTSCIKTSWLKMIWHARYFPLLSSTKADSEGHLYGWLWDRLMEAHKHLLLMSQLSTENKKRIYRLLRTMYTSIRYNSKIQYESISCSWLHPS